MFDYRQLEAFGAVIESGGFDKAADSLGLTQSAVTQRVKHLETYTGKPLLIRSNPPVPTEAGIPIYVHFKKIRILEEDLARDNQREFPGTHLSIGVNASTLGSWFLPALSRIMKSNLVDLHVGEAKVVHRLLQRGILAGCISIRSKTSRGCSVSYLGESVLRCVATKEFKERYFPQGLTKEGMFKAPAVLFHPESQMMRMFQKKSMGIAPFDVPAHYIPSQSEYLRMVGEGSAYGFLPHLLFEQTQADYRLIDLYPPAPVTIPQYWHRWDVDSKLLEMVTREIRDAARVDLLRTS